MGRSVAILSTPKTGNLWLRFCLERGLSLRSVGVHNEGELDCLLANPGNNTEFPFIFHAHINATPRRLHLLEKIDTDVVTLLRHPVDIFLSLRRHYEREPSQAWPENLLADRANAATYIERIFPSVLMTTASWIKAGTLPVRFEELNRTPAATLLALMDRLRHGQDNRAVAKFMAAISNIDIVRASAAASDRGHFALGLSGQWRFDENRDILEIFRNKKYLRDITESWGYSLDIEATPNELAASESNSTSALPLSIAFDDGTPFPPFLKCVFLYHRHCTTGKFATEHPTSVGDGSFFRWLTEIDTESHLGLTNIEKEAIRFRRDAAMAFSPNGNLDVNGLRAWLFVHGAYELELAPCLLEYTATMLASL